MKVQSASAQFQLSRHFTQGPHFTRGQNPNSVVFVHANQRMGTNLILDTNQCQIALWPPMQRHVDVAWKDFATPIRRPVPQDDFRNACLFSCFQNRNRSRMFPRRSQRNFTTTNLHRLIASRIRNTSKSTFNCVRLITARGTLN